MRKSLLLLSLLMLALNGYAQMPYDDMGMMSANDNGSRNRNRDRNGTMDPDSMGTDKEIPRGLHVWTVDNKFGDISKAQPDTLSHLFMNTILTTGKYGEYNTTGNLGAPRQNRIFIDRPFSSQFVFTQPYDFFIRQPEEHHFTNTLSPITNLSYNSAGNRTNGENHLTAKFAVNAGKRIGAGFSFDYLYGRGYYDSQSTSLFNYTMYGSYLGERYQAHLLLSTNHQKVTENGGITNDFYITHPESFNDNYQTSEIPTVLSRNWNRNDNQHIFLTHRYNVGFYKKVRMTEEEIAAKKFAMESKKQNEERKARERMRNGEDDEEDENQERNNKKKADEPTFSGRPDNAKVIGTEPADTTKAGGERIVISSQEVADSLIHADAIAQEDTTWMKDEYVPVTSFIHTLHLTNYKRIYQAYNSPAGYYADTFFGAQSDSIYDLTRHYRIKNTLAISLLEGFNKWAKAGLKVFATSDFRHFTLPDQEQMEVGYNEHTLSIGGQLAKQEGKTLHYNLLAETWLLGEDFGQLHLDATADVNFPLFGDTVTLAAKAFIHRDNPVFYFRKYHSKHLWWENDNLDKILHNRVEGLLKYQKTHTTLRIAVDNITNYTYFAQQYAITDDFGRTGNTVSVRQKDGSVNLLTASLQQDFKLGPLNWQSIITYQKSSDQDVLPLPDLNIYSNLFLRFKIAHVLSCDLGADIRYFTKYYAPDYSPLLGQYAVQESSDKIKLGNYPIIDAYANFNLKQARFFIMFTHVNAGNGNRNYFLTPHYPLNERIMRLGISWTFFN